MTTETFSEIGNPRPWMAKDPDAILDYVFDWTDWLAVTGDEISAYTIAVDGVTKTSDSRTGDRVTVWVSGGTALPGEVASVTCSITTLANRTDQRTIYLRIRER